MRAISRGELSEGKLYSSLASPATDTTTAVTFAPGTALIHRGHVPHMAHPMTDGERSNLVLWLMGDGMQIPRPGAPAPSVTPAERWSVPDSFAPF